MAENVDVVVIGGGPAGTVAALSIAATGCTVALMEKQSFPRETLCGEFLSVEVVGAVRDLGLEPEFTSLLPNPITTFTLMTGRGESVRTPLGFTAYGVRRGKFDGMLLEAARRKGVSILQPAEATGVERKGEEFVVRYRTPHESGCLRSLWVIGAYGRSSPLDKHLARSFAGAQTGFTGVKFHLPAEVLGDIQKNELVIALGPRIYCGVSHVGEDTATLCFLEQRRNGDPPSRARLRELARTNSDFARVVTPDALRLLLEAPVYGTGNIFFGPREAVENGVLMVGDSAGVIAPLAGDGISIAMEQGRLLGRIFRGMGAGGAGREAIYERYRRDSARLFARRRKAAMACQRVALSGPLRMIVAPILSRTPALLHAAIHATRGS